MSTAEVLRAKDICSVCPVRLDCLRTALAWREPSGVWGGMTHRERQRLLASVKGNLDAAMAKVGGARAAQQ